MTRQRMIKVVLFASGAVVTSLFPGCLIPLLPLASRVAGNALIDFLLELS